MGFVRGFIEQDGFKVEYYNIDGARVYSSGVLKSRMDK